MRTPASALCVFFEFRGTPFASMTAPIGFKKCTPCSGSMLSSSQLNSHYTDLQLIFNDKLGLPVENQLLVINPSFSPFSRG